MADAAGGNGEVSQLKRALQAIQQLRARLDAVERARTEPVAVVGMGCRFPGAPSPEAYWKLLVEGVDAVGDVPPERWNAEQLFAPEASARGKMNTRWGGFVEGVDQFDPGFFGITPREAERMDPQQRLLLETAWEALEDAGAPMERLAGSSGGVFVGVHSHSVDYAWLQMRTLGGIGTHTGTGTAHSILANRLSYWLDLRGPSMAVDTACSSSLVALHLACTSLRAGESDLALAAGVNLMLSPEASVTFSKLRMMAADGRCKTFDSRADGFVRGEGCGVVVLKRLSDAQASGDRILAVIAGSAVNQDGATNGLTAPNGLSQQLVVRRALDAAGVAPADVGFIETHGTGTPLGDPIEVEALTEVLGRSGDVPCALGAAKTNIGHLEAASGIAGVIKTVLAIRHRTIPPNLHFRELNPHISLDGTRFFVPTEARPWPENGVFAGVSSFGFGGANAHVVMGPPPSPGDAVAPSERGASAGVDEAGAEEHGGADAEGRSTNGRPAARRGWLLPISAQSEPALVELCERWRERLAGGDEALLDLCHTAGARRTHHEHRVALVGDTQEELATSLDAFLREGPGADARAGRAAGAGQRSLVFVFSGQGWQWAGMGRALLAAEPVFRERMEEVDALLRPLGGWSVLEALEAPAAATRLDQTEVAQPAVFAVQVALAELLRSWGVLPDAVVGHSSGEVAAAHVAGALELEEAVQVVFHRARLMQQATGGGRVAAIGLPADAARELVSAGEGRVFVGAVNSPAATVLTGDAGAVEAAVSRATERGAPARVLPMPYAFHSPQMEPFQPELVRALSGLRPRPARVRVFSTMRGGPAAQGDFDAEYWARNMRDPVLFGPAVAAAAQAGGTDWLEIGPHPSLVRMIEQCLEGAGGGGGAAASDADGGPSGPSAAGAQADAARGAVLGTLEQGTGERRALLRALASLYARGYPVDWRGLLPEGGRVVTVPGHPWRRKRYWFDPAKARRGGPRRSGADGDAEQ